MTPLRALQKSIKIAGSQAKLAEMLGVSQPAVFAWLNRSGRISGDYALKCHLALEGEVSVHDLRPDLYPRKLLQLVA